MSQTRVLHINGVKVKVGAEASRSLLSVLRDDLQLTGAKYGCGEGQCGACTVLIDGVARRSCITAVAQAENKEIQTIEGVSANGRLHPLQQAFLESEALQCGYCTPGMIMSALALLGKNPRPSRQEAIRAMEGNICRCGVYHRILAAIEKAAEATNGGQK